MSVIKSIELVRRPDKISFFWRIVDGGLIYTYADVNDALRYMQFKGEKEVYLKFVSGSIIETITKVDLTSSITRPNKIEKKPR